MRSSFSLLGILAVLFAAAASGSEGVDAVIKMQNNGVTQNVLLTYVQTSHTAYDPTGDEIQQLEDAKVPATVIVAMIDRGNELRKTTTTEVTTTATPADTTTTTTTTETTVVAPTAEDQNVTYFYESLAPYGEWVSIDNGGWAWRPSIVSIETDWRPYAHGGHWVWSDYGWYWESTYPWGWAAFHYGRWNYDDRHHWVWIPDTTWGPAWVTWRSSDRYFGWAPLPPGAVVEAGVGFSFHNNKNVGFNFDFGLSDREFVFVPSNAFLEVDIGRRALPRAEAVTVFKQTTIVNNTYITQNNHIVNNGIPEQQVAARTGKQPEQVKITDAHAAPGQRIKGETRQGSTIAAFRPKLNNTAPKDPPTVMKERREQAQANRTNGQTAKPQTNATNPPRATATPPPAGQASATTERDAQRRLAEEKTARREGRQAAAQDKRDTARENALQKRDELQTQREAQQKEAQQKRDASRENIEQKQNEAQAKRDAQQKETQQKQTDAQAQQKEAQAKRDAADQKRKDDVEAKREALEKEAQQRRDAVRDNNQQRRDDAQTQRDAQQKAAQERRDAARENAQQKPNEAQAQREAQQKAEQNRDTSPKSRDTTQQPQTNAQTQREAQQKAAQEDRRDTNREKLQQRQNEAQTQRESQQLEKRPEPAREKAAPQQNLQDVERDAQRRLQEEKERAQQPRQPASGV